MLQQRQLQPEILDSLSPDDPAAIRSRADLRRINAFMGNKRWLKKQIDTISRDSDQPIHLIEIGSGDGSFLSIFANQNDFSLLGVDLVPKPNNLAKKIDWLSGDLFEISSFPFKKGHTNIVVCNLILHHFTDQQLALLGEILADADHILAVEPLRTRLPLILARLAFPFVNHVTRHDMIASIKAGFRNGELAAHFPAHRAITESTSQRGSVRLHLT